MTAAEALLEELRRKQKLLRRIQSILIELLEDEAYCQAERKDLVELVANKLDQITYDLDAR